MIQKTCLLIASSGLAAALLAGSALAQSAPGNPGTGEVSRDPSLKLELAKRKVVGTGVVKIEEDEKSRGAVAPDPEELLKGFKTRSKSKGGAVKEEDAPASLKSAIEDDVKAQSAAANTAPPVGDADEPEEGSRQVFGDDDRVRITNTQDFPYRVIGQLWSQTAAGDWSTCSATLVGPKTVVTAAHCLYSHDNGGWLDNFEFYPGLNGPDDAPFGLYGYETAHILEGFVTNYQGFYGSVVPWDLGVVVLDSEAGNDLGWLGYQGSDRMSSFKANIVGYPGDKDASTMWAAVCDANAKDSDLYNFAYLCDTFPGSSGSSVYRYDAKTKDRAILGINVAESPAFNTAVRFNKAYFGWLQSVVE